MAKKYAFVPVSVVCPGKPLTNTAGLQRHNLNPFSYCSWSSREIATLQGECYAHQPDHDRYFHQGADHRSKGHARSNTENGNRYRQAALLRRDWAGDEVPIVPKREPVDMAEANS